MFNALAAASLAVVGPTGPTLKAAEATTAEDIRIARQGFAGRVYGVAHGAMDQGGRLQVSLRRHEDQRSGYWLYSGCECAAGFLMIVQ